MDPYKQVIQALIQLTQDVNKPKKAARPVSKNQTQRSINTPSQFASYMQTTIYQAALKRSQQANPTPFSKRDIEVASIYQKMLDRLIGWDRQTKPASPQKIAWVKWLTQPGRLPDHFNTVLRLLTFNMDGKYLLRVDLAPQTSLYRYTRRGNQVHLEVHEGFIDAPDEVLRAIVDSAVSRRTSRRSRMIQNYADGPRFAEIATALSQAGPEFAQGKHVNLTTLFDQVNRDFYKGKIQKPRLCWSRTATYRTLGKYQASTDTLTISRSLDAPDVPSYVLRFIMYHELLHKVLGTRVVNGRHYGHTAEFRAYEKRFPEYSAVQEWLERFSRSVE